MAKSGKRRPMVSRPATISTSSSTTVASSSPYFPPELIPLIASRLTNLQDFFTLRAACRAYRVCLPLSSSNLASQGPLLLVHHDASASDALFHVPSRRILQFRLPRTDGNPILTTFRSFRRRLLCAEDMEDLTCFHSLGCLAIQNIKVGGSRPELRVQHLLTGERSRLPYPPDVFRFQFPGLVFSGDLFVAFTPCCRDLYYCRIGDAHWRAARCDGGYDVYCLLFFKGILYALVYPNYRLATVELENDSVALSFLGDNLIPQKVSKGSSFWLAECGGELFLGTVFSGGDPGRASGKRLAVFVVVACSSIDMSLQDALVQIIRQFEETACTLLQTLGTGSSILWLIDLCTKSLPNTQDNQQVIRKTYRWLGSFQAFADALQVYNAYQNCPQVTEEKFTCVAELRMFQ